MPRAKQTCQNIQNPPSLYSEIHRESLMNVSTKADNNLIGFFMIKKNRYDNFDVLMITRNRQLPIIMIIIQLDCL